MSVWLALRSSENVFHRSWRLTEALVGPSWLDVPLTLKFTPLGALDLTSILASSNYKLNIFIETIERLLLPAAM